MQVATRPIAPVTLLTLGRVSNLPTVWTNVLAGTALSDVTVISSWRIVVPILAISLLYVGGMYLNDFFDRAIDACERPQRPIPSGSISAVTVCTLGFAMLCAGVALLATVGAIAGFIAALLALFIVFYDAFHKGNPFAPAVMGLCRALVYGGAAAAAVGAGAQAVILAALALAAYVAGLTYAARQESLDRVGNLGPLVLLFAPMALALPALAHGLLQR
jgi:4-hydroxybenzoate polyprenyltransferase